MTTVTTIPTLFRPVTIGIRSTERADYRATTPLGSRLEWEPMAGCVDWSAIDDLDEFYVRVRYAEYVETRKKSEHAAYNGRRDFKRVPDGRGFGRTICKVVRGEGAHVVRIKRPDGSITERIIQAVNIMRTVRTFVSAQYVRRGLDMLIAEYEQLGANIVKNTVRMTILPMEDCSDGNESND